jgi:hypothetical protein
LTTCSTSRGLEPHRLIDPADGLNNGHVEYQVQVTDPTRLLKIALCWTDAPGNPTAAVCS